MLNTWATVVRISEQGSARVGQCLGTGRSDYPDVVTDVDVVREEPEQMSPTKHAEVFSSSENLTDVLCSIVHCSISTKTAAHPPLKETKYVIYAFYVYLRLCSLSLTDMLVSILSSALCVSLRAGFKDGSYSQTDVYINSCGHNGCLLVMFILLSGACSEDTLHTQWICF